MKFLAWIERLFGEHKFARRALLFWAMGIITYTVVKFFEIAKEIASPASVIIAILGLLSVAASLYPHYRSTEGKVIPPKKEKDSG